MFLVEGGGGFEGEGFAIFHDLGGVDGEVIAVVFEGFVRGVFFPMGAEFEKGKEGGRFAEGFFKPFVFVFGGLEIGADVGEFVGELVDELGVVAVGAVELDGDFFARGSLKKGDGAIAMMGDEQGRALGFWEDGDGGFEEGAEFPFLHAEAVGIDAELGGGDAGEAGQAGEEEEQGLHFLRLGSRLPLMRAWMRSGQAPPLRRRSQAASIRRLWRTGR